MKRKGIYAKVPVQKCWEENGRAPTLRIVLRSASTDPHQLLVPGAHVHIWLDRPANGRGRVDSASAGCLQMQTGGSVGVVARADARVFEIW